MCKIGVFNRVLDETRAKLERSRNTLQQACVMCNIDFDEALKEVKRINTEGVIEYNDAVMIVIDKILRNGKL